MTRNSIAKNYVRSNKQRVVILPGKEDNVSNQSSSLDAIAKQLQYLSELELEEVKDMVAALLMEARRQLNEPLEEEERELGGLEDMKSRGSGHIELKMIPNNGRLYGPYRYLRYWSQGRLKSRYLGKA